MALPGYTVRSGDRVAYVYAPFASANDGLAPGYYTVVCYYPQAGGKAFMRWSNASKFDDNEQETGAKQVARRFVADSYYAIRRKNEASPAVSPGVKSDVRQLARLAS